MNGVGLTPLEAGPADADVAALVTRRLAAVDPLRAAVAQWRRENLEWRPQAGYGQSRQAEAVRRLAVGEPENEQRRGENRQRPAERLGRRSEQPSGSDRSQELADPADAKTKRPRGRPPGQPAPRRRAYRHRPVREQFLDLPEADQIGPGGGRPLKACGPEASEPLASELLGYRRVIRRQRGQRTGGCPGPRTGTAPPASKLLPQSLRGVSRGVEILLDQFASYRPTQRLLEHWRLWGLDGAAGTVTDGRQRLEPLVQPILEMLRKRNRQAPLKQAAATRWLVWVEQPGQVGFGWWRGVFTSADTVVYRRDDARSPQVPEDHYPPRADGVLLVDRSSASKALLQVKNGTRILAFCWAQVRRDLVRVGKGWPEWTSGAVEWLRRIRDR